MKDDQIQNSLARVMVIGTLTAAGIMLAGMIWYLSANQGIQFSDHIFHEEPKYFETPLLMLQRAMDMEAYGHRRSLVMIGISLLLINPLLRVAFAVTGFAAQKDRLYTAISVIVFTILLFSFFW